MTRRGMWKSLYASLQGSSHGRLGVACQDFCEVREMRLRDETILILACADGAGSAELSDLGSQLACQRIIWLIRSEFDGCCQLPSISQDQATRWLTCIRNDLDAEARVHATNIRQLACTLLVAVVGERTSTFFQIGDGAIVVRRADTLNHVFWPQIGEYANTTFFVGDTSYEHRMAFAVIDERIDELALFTDGLQMLALDFRKKTVHQPFFEPLFNSMRACDRTDNLVGPMQRFLTSQAINDRTDDDKTLILASRIP